MTAPPRHEPTPSRRAARAQRERGDQRAVDEARATTRREAQRAREAARGDSEAAREAAAEARATADTVPIRIVSGRASPLVAPTVVTESPVTTAVIHLAPPSLDPPPLPAPVMPRDEEELSAPTGFDVVAPRRSRSGQLLDIGVLPRPAPVRHARVGLVARLSSIVALITGATLVVASASAMTSAVAPPPVVAVAAQQPIEQVKSVPPPAAAPTDIASAPFSASALQPQAASIDPASIDLCADPGFTTALAAGDDAAAIAAAGGAVPFRDAVAAGRAACVALDDPSRVWVVVDKQRPFAPIDFQPASLETPGGMRNPDGGTLRTDAAAAMAGMAEASLAAGAGEIAIVSAYRSYRTQVDTYNGHVADRGVEGADLVSARPGFSEHQSGLAADVAPCDASCHSIDDLAASAQGQWVLAHAWEHGWIVRYEDGSTPATGYLAEPWHLRYIGPELARAYHDGQWQTLEEFFGLPPAPDYAQ